jgi:hypothetical protein
MTMELPETYATKDEAMDAAVKALQDAVDINDDSAQIAMTARILHGVAMECRVFADHKVLSGEQHEFIIDICDGAI